MPDGLADDHDPGRDPAGDSVRWTALLREAGLGARDAGRAPASTASPVGGPRSDDVERLAAHLGGNGDDALLEAASRDPQLRSVLVDVVDAIETVAQGGDADTVNPETLAPSVLDRARDAYRRPAPIAATASATPSAAAPTGTTGPSSVLRMTPSTRRKPAHTLWRSTAVRAAAAVLLVAVPLGVLATLSSRSVEASPLLAVEGIERLDASGALSSEGPRTLHVGDRVCAAGGERWSVRLTGGARVIVGDHDVLRVACDSVDETIPANPAMDAVAGSPSCRRAVLQLDAGEALIAAGVADGKDGNLGKPDASAISSRGAPVLLLPGGGRLEVLAGAVHVALASADGAAVAIRAGGRASWTPARKASATRELVGPTTVLLGTSSPSAGAEESKAAESLFRDLDFFGGPRASDAPDRRVPAMAWRVLPDATSAVAASKTSDAGAPARRFELAAGQSVRLAWDLDDASRDAKSIRLLLRVRSTHADATGIPLPDTALPSIDVSVDGMGVTTLHGVLAPRTMLDGRPDETRTLSLTLPDGWAGSMRGSPASRPAVSLTLRADGAGAVLWFEGAAFSRREAPSAAPR